LTQSLVHDASHRIAEGGVQSFNIILFGTASTVVFSLIAQIGEQVDFLRFLPPRGERGRLAWWFANLTAGPGWIVLGALKLMAGSFLAFLAMEHLIAPETAAEPTQMYWSPFNTSSRRPMPRWLSPGLLSSFRRSRLTSPCLCRLDRLVEFFLAPHA